MIKGIGMDIIEISRIAKLAEAHPKFPERILAGGELKRFSELKDKRKMEFLAGRFSAKEAFSKAYGTGIGKELSFLDMEISYDSKGKPIFIAPISTGVHLSITHSSEYAAAQVVIEESE
ncbi:holo-ACP synthase [Bacillus sp. MUM 13]|uniref:holo-ACP synthase n=1 Tax=Bacillus sp. MUM 13 TaxID=1678001 RepID=UPI0008F5C039|nr:holo-ACP synthase [Bacillus sp. MUM 13]OIK10888.1 holo-ACP synthase [Bacillus sp. MUM 13]